MAIENTFGTTLYHEVTKITKLTKVSLIRSFVFFVAIVSW